MALEDLTGGAKFIDSLVAGNPVSNDDRREGDDHIRGIKNVLRNTFPNVNGAVSATDEQLNAAAAISGGAFPGSVTVGGDLAVTGKGAFGGDVVAPNFYIGLTPAAGGTFGVQAPNGANIITWGNSASGAGSMTFSAGGSVRMTLDAAGKVGIGGPSSGPKLFVTTGQQDIAALDSTNAGGGWLQFSISGGAAYGHIGSAVPLVAAGGLGPTDIAMRSAGQIVFAHGPVETMRIDATGKVGVGGPPVHLLTVREGGGNPAVQSWFNAAGMLGLVGEAAALISSPPANALCVRAENVFVVAMANIEAMRINSAGKITQQNGLVMASDPGAAAGAVPIGGMVIGAVPGGTNINGLVEFTGALTIFATGSGVNGATPAGQKWRNCGALSSTSSVALWVRTA